MSQYVNRGISLIIYLYYATNPTITPFPFVKFEIPELIKYTVQSFLKV